jgi:hypothetical protein
MIAEIGTPLLICLNCNGKLIPAINRIVASRFPLSGDWLAAISFYCVRPIEMNKPHTVAKVTETDFYFI